MHSFYFEWEFRLIRWLQSFLNGAGAVAVMGAVTRLGEELVLVALLAFFYFSYNKEHGKYLGINVLVGIVLNPLVKNVFLRPRPYMVDSGVKCLQPVDGSADPMDIAAQGYSFPSGHSMNALIAYGSAARCLKRRWAWITAAALAFLIGLSRVGLGVHFPTDVLAGWALGAAVLFLVPLLRQTLHNDKLLFPILLLLGLPGMFYCSSTDYFSGYGMMLGGFAGFLFEDRFVKFENTRSPLFRTLRLIGGLAVFLGLNTLLKLPFSGEFLSSGTLGALLVRTGRYTLVSFGVVGAYPLLFRPVEKRFGKQ